MKIKMSKKKTIKMIVVLRRLLWLDKNGNETKRIPKVGSHYSVTNFSYDAIILSIPTESPRFSQSLAGTWEMVLLILCCAVSFFES